MRATSAFSQFGRTGLPALVLCALFATTASAQDATATDASPTTTSAPTATPTAAPVAAEATPTALRLRALEQRVQALKEKAWRQKARVGMLKESAIGGGIGAMATIGHTNKMGSSFRLIQLVYTLDGTQIFARNDDTAATMYKTKALDVFAGPIGPGTHTLTVVANYRGHGYGVFKYLSKYTYQAKESYTFSIEEGKSTKVQVIGYEKGGLKTPMEKRPSIEFKVTQSDVPTAPSTPQADGTGAAVDATVSTTVKPGA